MGYFLTRIISTVAIYLALSQGALAFRNIPALSRPVIDEAGLFSQAEIDQLENEIRAQLNIAQAQIWTVPELEGEAIEALSIRATDAWQLGDKKTDRGLLILLSIKERKIRIEVGQGLEGDIPDAIAARVVRNIMVPLMRERNPYQAVSSALTALYKLARGETAEGSEGGGFVLGQNSSKLVLYGLLLFAFVMTFLARLFSFFLPRAGGGGRRVSHGSGWAGTTGWGGGFGGGGGWSGGGGGFSGGGGSGSW